MAVSKKQQDTLKAKQKRQKIIAIGGAVLLLALLAFQVPRTMKMLNAQAPPPPPPAAAPSSVPTDPSILPTPGAAAGAAAPAAGGAAGLVDSDVAPSAASGQLVAFGHFASKDPFHQQIDVRALERTAGTRASSPTKPGTGSTPPPTSTPTPTPADSSGGVVAPTTSAPSTPSGPSVASGSALIAVNGVEGTVARGASFPEGSPIFTLVSIAKGRVKIAIAGGAFASGARTIPLTEGKTVTLVNTADGTRYELKLVAAGA